MSLSGAAPREDKIRRKHHGLFPCCPIYEVFGCKFPAASLWYLEQAVTAGLQYWGVSSTASRSSKEEVPADESLAVAERSWVNLLQESSLYFALMWHSSELLLLSSSSCLLVNNHLHPEHMAALNVCLYRIELLPPRPPFGAF